MTIEYVAGFFDGEGSISIRHSNKLYSHKYVNISIGQKLREDDVLNKMIIFLKSCGVDAKLYTVGSGKDTGIYRIVIADNKNVKIFLKLLLPHLVVKRSKAIEALERANHYGSRLQTKINIF